jgi:transposase-like protein
MSQKSIRTVEEQEAIIAEYLTGSIGYRKLGVKHGINFRRIHLWVMKFQGRTLKKPKAISSNHPVSKQERPLPTNVKQLQEELRRAKLYNELLNAMMDIAEDRLKIDIRKKSGTKR